MKININVFDRNFKIIISKISSFVFINEGKNIFNETGYYIVENIYYKGTLIFGS